LDPPKNGNCQFSCLAQQLNSIALGNWTDRSLRQELVEFISSSESMNITDFVVDCDERQYLQRMAADRCFGDHITLLAAAKRFNIQIIVLSNSGAASTRILSPTECSSTFQKDIQSILLGHYSEDAGQHYVSLACIAGKSSEDIVTSRTRRTAGTLDSPGTHSNETRDKAVRSLLQLSTITTEITQTVTPNVTHSSDNNDTTQYAPAPSVLGTLSVPLSSEECHPNRNPVQEWPSVWTENQWRDKQATYSWLRSKGGKLGKCLKPIHTTRICCRLAADSLPTRRWAAAPGWAAGGVSAKSVGGKSAVYRRRANTPKVSYHMSMLIVHYDSEEIK
jgi:hypothetical protein